MNQVSRQVHPHFITSGRHCTHANWRWVVIFADRYDAGRRLAAVLGPHRVEHPLVLGLPRGGVVVAYEIATALGTDLDVLVVRKLGVPGAEEYALGAIAPGAILLNPDLITQRRMAREYTEP